MTRKRTIAEMREPAHQLGWHIEKVEFEDRWKVTYWRDGKIGDFTHHEFQDASTARLREWLDSDVESAQ